MARKRNYIIWQNRAVRFYLAARCLWLEAEGLLCSASGFCAQQALEDLLKATLIYYVKNFDPKSVGHSFKKMFRMLRNQVPNGGNVSIPEYFYAQSRFRVVSRYPAQGKGVYCPACFMDDLDKTFVDLLELVNYQFKLNSELKGILCSPDEKIRRQFLTKDNGQKERLIKILANR